MYRIIFLNNCGELVKDSKVYASYNKAKIKADETLFADSDYKDYYLMPLNPQVPFCRQPLWVVSEVIKNLARSGQNYRIFEVENTIAYIKPCCK